MIGGVTRHMLPHLSGIPHLHVTGLKLIRGKQQQSRTKQSTTLRAFQKYTKTLLC